MVIRLFNAKYFKGLKILLCILLIAMSFTYSNPVNAAATTYYVSTSGSNSSSGTLSAPWKDINYAVNHIAAGDTIIVRGGTYYERVVIPINGSSTQYCQLQNYSGESVILSGSGVSLSGEQGLIEINGKSYWRITGFEVAYYQSTTAGNSPNGVFIHGASSCVELWNLNIHDINHNNVTLSNYAGSHGILVKGEATSACSNIYIENCNIHNNITGWSENLTLNGYVDTFEIKGCTIHDGNNIGMDIAGTWNVNSDPTKDFARKGSISQNIVYNIDSRTNPAYGNTYGAAGIYLDGGQSTTVERNKVYSCNYGIAASSENSGKYSSNNTVINNFVYNNYASGITIGGYGTGNGGTSNCKFLNNTLFQNCSGVDEGEIRLMYHNISNTFLNNIVYARTNTSFVRKYSPSNDGSSGNNMNFNCYFNSGVTASWWWNNIQYTTYAAWKTATAFDLNSTSGTNPLLVSTATPDLHIQATSPCKNKGTNDASIGSYDYDGQSRIYSSTVDIGADELQN